MTEYKLPVRNVGPYSIWVDKKDENIIWGSDFMNSNYLQDYGFSPFSYNTKTNKMYYYPAPRGAVGFETFTEPNNTVWFTAKTCHACSSQDLEKSLHSRDARGLAIHFYPEGYTPDAPARP